MNSETPSAKDIRTLERRFFDPTLTDRERAIFEAGVALGSICHQFVGVPVAPDPTLIHNLQETIARSTRLQPYKTKVEARIDLNRIRKPKHIYDYESLREEHLELTVETTYGAARATARMKYVPQIHYPLMYVEKVENG